MAYYLSCVGANYTTCMTYSDTPCMTPFGTPCMTPFGTPCMGYNSASLFISVRIAGDGDARVVGGGYGVALSPHMDSGAAALYVDGITA